MIYPCEREIGFDGAEIGFPAVAGCRAVVLVTAGGLIGYHLNGNLSDTKKDAFVHFVTTNANGVAKRNLYAASKQGGNGPTSHCRCPTSRFLRWGEHDGQPVHWPLERKSLAAIATECNSLALGLH